MNKINSIGNKIGEIGKKYKRFVDLLFLAFLFVYISSIACLLTQTTPAYIVNLYYVSTAVLSLIALLKMLFLYFIDRKKALILFVFLIIGVIIYLFSGSNLALYTVTVAIAGFGVKADYILTAGISGNLVMILNNILISLSGNSLYYTVDNQERRYFFFGNNSFYLSKMNNLSSTDFAAHYFWIIAAFLWIRGKKITWGEIFALAGLDILIYSLTAAKTSFICVLVLVISAIIYKLLLASGLSDKIKNVKSLSKGLKIFSSIFGYGCKFSFIILALISIALSILYNNSSEFFFRLNDSLHSRLSLAHRGIVEYGIHLFSNGMPMYGMSSSADGFYNFVDCSYMKILLSFGIVMFVFYVFSMSAILLRHKNYIFGAIILAVCALSCFEEHHLSEVSYNFFVLLMFADLSVDEKINLSQKSGKSKKYYFISIISYVLCFDFIFYSVSFLYPKYKAVKELDKLDGKAASIYSSVQHNIDSSIDNGSWKSLIDSVSSYQYGDVLECPADFSNVTGSDWSTMTSDPKVHSYYSLYYSSDLDTCEYPVLDLLISDEVKNLVGDGSIIIEYDVSSGQVYSVWYCEVRGCSIILDGRRADRIGRLREDVAKVEGYSTCGI